MTCSQKLWPTWPLELPMPLGYCGERDSSIRRADSSVEAARITTFAFASSDLPETVSTNPTPRALPVFLSTSTSCPVELVRSVKCPVSIDGQIRPVGESKAAWMSHPPGRERKSVE